MTDFQPSPTEPPEPRRMVNADPERTAPPELDHAPFDPERAPARHEASREDREARYTPIKRRRVLRRRRRAA